MKPSLCLSADGRAQPAGLTLLQGSAALASPAPCYTAWHTGPPLSPTSPSAADQPTPSAPKEAAFQPTSSTNSRQQAPNVP